ncbi:hypothetical protein CAP31_10770 [Sulfuriferula sp. AH1]|uniref:hypothetical protein n=1 Tax=Sulfuriferula sp. AH1 TaxID=1985873 RepID=UPI000B3B6797|nr:hypothetical protein [Sulfuriferula sp. AH1]ARU32116.1 hypothetical protein CAP31_10770 [Sulfuriferula sp. AH1]
MKFVLALLWLWPAASGAVTVDICYNYGCAVHAKVALTSTQMRNVRELFRDAVTPPQERAAISLGIGLLESYAAEQTPTGNDKGGNVADDGRDGRMDCIDHSRNTTAYLHLLQRFGFLSFHDVLPPVERAPFVVNVHWGAQIEEFASGRKFVVDSWFRDNGAPAVIYPLQDWLRGTSPDE